MIAEPAPGSTPDRQRAVGELAQHAFETAGKLRISHPRATRCLRSARKDGQASPSTAGALTSASRRSYQGW
ncbi:hypothetical protein SAMN05421869_14947 [Nonomuraea jiangxiensis]|uniref:Uncharacterized protein n=1 Tax=Nonomuraea jiangxiensis TaxID=633440 RepID=A0A1G9UQ08_9ACTN|nr:hypothetical protein SAMN05421869_14947 [Nonomuraea jiangxiensis]